MPTRRPGHAEATHPAPPCAGSALQSTMPAAAPPRGATFVTSFDPASEASNVGSPPFLGDGHHDAGEMAGPVDALRVDHDHGFSA
ncbi:MULTISPECIES: hypothetical protein [Sorangium]|uniref:hypothetical protein n=1 Tax=Sorangium TaxID=39643 RepID=UPI003D9C1C7A